MAIILFGQQAQTQKGQQDSEVTYAEFIGKAMGRVTLRGQYLVDENGLRVNAKAFLDGMLHDDITLTPCTRYQAVDEGNNGAYVSPLTRGRNTGWSFGNDAFISVNTMVGLISPGFQLPEYRTTRTCPRPTGQVNDEMWIVGPWAARDEFKLFVTDGNQIEPLESWITRKLQSVN